MIPARIETIESNDEVDVRGTWRSGASLMPAHETSDGSAFARVLRQYRTELSLLSAVLAVVGLTILLDPSRAYLDKPIYNATEILRQTALLGILALGASVVIISGGIDLSAGSV